MVFSILILWIWMLNIVYDLKMFANKDIKAKGVRKRFVFWKYNFEIKPELKLNFS